MTRNRRLFLLAAVTGIAVVAVFALLPPIGQDPAYHDLADRRTVLGIPRFGDVVSNALFTIVGLAGLGALQRARLDTPRMSRRESRPFVVFFVGVALVGPGSAWYHLDPNSATLFWDRLPMTIAFMALVSGIIADRIDARWGGGWGLALLVAVGVASVVAWRVGEANGAGDLRAYALVQFYPLIAIPLILWLFPAGTRVHPRHIAVAFGFYVLAKFAEFWDAEIFRLTGEIVSGHTLKHLLAAVAPAAIMDMLQIRVAAEQPLSLRA